MPQKPGRPPGFAPHRPPEDAPPKPPENIFQKPPQNVPLKPPDDFAKPLPPGFVPQEPVEDVLRKPRKRPADNFVPPRPEAPNFDYQNSPENVAQRPPDNFIAQKPLPPDFIPQKPPENVPRRPPEPAVPGSALEPRFVPQRRVEDDRAARGAAFSTRSPISIVINDPGYHFRPREGPPPLPPGVGRNVAAPLSQRPPEPDKRPDNLGPFKRPEQPGGGGDVIKSRTGGEDGDPAGPRLAKL
jgi:hypothetical protein